MASYLVFIIAAALAAAAFFVLFVPLKPAVRRLSGNALWQSDGPLIAGLIAAVAAFAIAFVALSGTGGGKSATEAKVLDEIHRYRFVRVLEKYQPEAKKQIEDIVHEAVTRDDPGLAEQRTAQLVQGYFPRYVPVTSDEAITGFARALVDILSYLEKNDVQTCKTLATGGQLGKAISAERMTPTLDAMAQVIEDGATKPQAKPDRERAQGLVQQVFAQLYAGNDPNLVPQAQLVTPAQAPADRLCHTMQAFYRTVLALPKADASIVMRTLIGGRQA